MSNKQSYDLKVTLPHDDKQMDTWIPIRRGRGIDLFFTFLATDRALPFLILPDRLFSTMIPAKAKKKKKEID